MVRITEDLIRKKAEHHDGVLPELEEITLHQMEIEKIEVIGNVCRKLQILYLQNNIIPKMENLHHLKSLRYLNLALNNITRIEGLSTCEFLTKLDLTVNFVDLDTFEDSIEHLKPLLHLREIYLMGNPCTSWEGHRDYVAAMLPQLVTMDGKEFTRADRITARQRVSALREELHILANEARERKGLPQEEPRARSNSDDEAEPYTPEVRVRMYREMAEQKAEQEARKKHMEPRERDYNAEHVETVEKVRQREADGSVRQTNEGRWEFSVDDEDGKGNCVLRLSLSRYLDTSLIDVDVHPSYVSVVIKAKTFRILWPEEVKATDGNCQRSQTTGELVITVPKVHPGRVTARPLDGGGGPAGKGKAGGKGTAGAGGGATSTRNLKPTKTMSLADELADLAQSIARGAGSATAGGPQARTAPKVTQQEETSEYAGDLDDSEVPPLE